MTYTREQTAPLAPTHTNFRSGELYTLEIAVDVALESTAFGLTLDKTSIATSKLISNVPRPIDPSKEEDNFYNQVNPDLIATLKSIELSGAGTTQIKPTLGLEFPTHMPISAALPPLDVNALSLTGAKLFSVSLGGEFVKGFGDLVAVGAADPATALADYTDMSTVSLEGAKVDGVTKSACFMQEVLNNLDVVLNAPDTTTADSKPTGSIGSVEVTQILNNPDAPFDILAAFTASSEQFLTAAADIDFSFPLSSTFSHLFDAAVPVLVTVSDDALSMAPSASSLLVHLDTMQGTFDESLESIKFKISTHADFNPSEKIADLTTGLDFTTADERFKKMLELFYTPDSSSDSSTSDDADSPSFFDSLSLFLSSSPDSLSLQTLFNEFSNSSIIKLPDDISASIQTSTAQVLGELTQHLGNGTLALTSVETLAEVLADFFSNVPTTLKLAGDFINLDIELKNDFSSSLTSLITSRRLNSEYVFEFPTSTASNWSFIDSLEILSMESIEGLTNTLEDKEFNMKLPTTAEIDALCLFGLCGTDIGFNMSLPALDLDLFFGDDEGAAGSVATEAFDWWSDLASGGKLWLDSSISVMNKQGGLVDKILAIANSKEDVTMRVKGASTAVDDFLSKLLAKLTFEMTFDSDSSDRRLGTPTARGTEFLKKFKPTYAEQHESRRLDEYTGEESVGLLSMLTQTEDKVNLENTMFVWPHLYNLPFDLKVGEMNLAVTLSDVDATQANLKLNAFALHQKAGGVIDAVLEVAKERKDSLRDIIKSFWADDAPLTLPTFDLAGSLTGSDGESHAVDFSFLQPTISGGISSFFSAVDDERRRLATEKVTELVKIDLFGGGVAGSDATIPCMVPELCADELINSKLGSSTFNTAISVLAVPLPKWIMWGLDLPDFTVDIKTGLDKLVSVSLYGSSVDNALSTESNVIALSSATTLVNPTELYKQLKPLFDETAGALPVFTIAPSADADMLSYLFSGVETSIDMADYIKRSSGRRLAVNHDDWGTGECAGEEFPVTNMKNFFNPTKCQHTYEVTQSSADSATMSFQLIHPPSPVRFDLNSLDIQVKYKDQMIYGISAPYFSIGAAACDDDGVCPPQAIEFTMANSDELGEFNGRIMEEAIRAFTYSDPDPLEFQLDITYFTPCVDNNELQCTFADLGESVSRQKVIMDLMLFEETFAIPNMPDPDLPQWGSGRKLEDGEDAVVAETACSNSDYTGECCNECVNDYSKLYSSLNVDVSASLYESAQFWNGFDLIFELELCNVFNFDLFVKDLTVSVVYDDDDGEDNWFSPYYLVGGYDSATNIELVSAQTETFSSDENPSGFRMESGKCNSTSLFRVTIDDDLTEHLNRIYDEAFLKGRFCLGVQGSVTLGFGMPNGELFTWVQPMNIPTTNILGPAANVCNKEVGCVTDKVTKLSQVGETGRTNWVRGNGAEITEDGQKITLGEYQAAWWTKPINVLEDWTVSFTVAEDQTGTFWAGKGFCFVIQNSDAGLGAFSTEDDGFGYKGIDKSTAVCFDTYASNEAYIFKNGVTSGAEVDPVNNNAYASGHTLDDDASAHISIDYNAASQLMRVYYTKSSEPVGSRTELMAAKLDTTFAGTSGEAFFGFTAEENVIIGSGSLFEITAMEVAVAGVSVGHTMLLEQGLTKTLGAGSMTFSTRTSCDTALRTGGEVFGGLRFIHKDESLKRSFDVAPENIEDLGDGRYKFNYVGCNPDDLTGWFEYCSDYEGKYYVYLQEAVSGDWSNIGMVKLIETE